MPLPVDSKARKRVPLHSGVIAYFPDALIEVAKVSFEGNEIHNPGEPLHWAKEKSRDHEDCIARHTIDALQSKTREERIKHKANRAWRALADLQIEIETPENGPAEPLPVLTPTAAAILESYKEYAESIKEVPNRPELPVQRGYGVDRDDYPSYRTSGRCYA